MDSDESEIRLEELRQLCDFDAGVERVERALDRALEGPAELVRFVGRYASWNGWFGSGVAALSGKIGRSRALFVDPDEPVSDLADRSVLVASYFFDAARDEFDDRDTAHRDTHRCLAQALLKGLLAELAREAPRLAEPAFVNSSWPGRSGSARCRRAWRKVMARSAPMTRPSFFAR